MTSAGEWRHRKTSLETWTSEG